MIGIGIMLGIIAILIAVVISLDEPEASVGLALIVLLLGIGFILFGLVVNESVIYKVQVVNEGESDAYCLDYAHDRVKDSNCYESMEEIMDRVNTLRGDE